MMQRILTGFSALPGADQAYVVSRREGLVAAVGKRGRAPDVEHATQLIQALDMLSTKQEDRPYKKHGNIPL